MGHGIAQVAAMAGYDAVLTDASEAALDTALLRIRENLDGAVERAKLTAKQAHDAANHLGFEPDVDRAVRHADLIIEAVVEDLDTKRKLFARVSAVSPKAILATNTSSLSVAGIAAGAAYPERVVGMHFFNPVHIMRLVEIVPHGGTDAAVTTQATDIARRMGKDPIVVRDTPGFASSRLGVVLGLEAMRMVEQGVASAEDIDKAMELGYGHPMGPLKVTDLVGLDVRLAIADYLHRELKDERYAAPDILRRMVSAGDLGKKSGKGFYDWPATT
ncbi:MAG: 3-hydroxyacyl-CoA dehydrogenase family protein [Gemmatimonadetes bacterium]|nr:3-hydroxyacyl-CoA dehydrogenase family protein [Gemmatimonadota bacterium]